MVMGLTRLRRHLFKRQAAFGTPLAAVRAYPFSGVPMPDLNWTDAEADQGARVLVQAPTRGIANLTPTLTDNRLNYNDLPLQLCAFFGNGVSPTGGGSAKTYTYEPDLTVEGTPDVFTYERGSDPDGTSGKPNDWFRWSDGIITQLTIDSPEDGRGVLTTSMQWLFGDVQYAGNSEGPGLSIPSITDRPDTNPVPIYLKDASVYISNDASDIGGTQISDAVHKFTLTLTQEVDQKRYVNGSQDFDLDGYGMGLVGIEVAIVCGKTADTVGSGSESDAWFSDVAVNRFLQIAFESPEEAQSGTPYSWVHSMPLRWYTREDGEIGGNETLTLTGRAYLDDDLDYAVSDEVVCTLAEADLGVA